MKAQDLKSLNIPPKILLHGDAGTGKTGLIAQLSNAYLLDFDGGMRTALELKDNFTKYRHRIEFDIYKDKSFRNPQGWNTAFAKLLSITELVARNKWTFDALCIDSMTGLALAIRHFVMFTKTGDALAEPERNHWGMMVNCMEAVCSIIMTIEVPVFITAHDCTVQTEDDTTYKILSMTKNHGEKIPWMFDEVWLAQIKKKGVTRQFTISGEGTAARIAKTKMNLGKDVDFASLGLKGIFNLCNFDYDFDRTVVTLPKKIETVKVKEVMKPASANNLLSKN